MLRHGGAPIWTALTVETGEITGISFPTGKVGPGPIRTLRGVRRRSENVFREKVSGKKKYVRGKRDHKLTGPGRTVWVVRTGRRGEEEVERVCSDRHETCTLYLQLLEPDNLYVNSHRFWRSLVPHWQRLAVPGLFSSEICP